VNIPILVRTDNIGAIFVTENAFVLGTWIHVITLSENSLKTALLGLSSSVQPKMILIYLRKPLVRSCMRGTRRNFWKKIEITTRYEG
jgi:hypothetical protein